MVTQSESVLSSSSTACTYGQQHSDDSRKVCKRSWTAVNLSGKLFRKKCHVDLAEENANDTFTQSLLQGSMPSHFISIENSFSSPDPIAPPVVLCFPLPSAQALALIHYYLGMQCIAHKKLSSSIPMGNYWMEKEEGWTNLSRTDLSGTILLLCIEAFTRRALRLNWLSNHLKRHSRKVPRLSTRILKAGSRDARPLHSHGTKKIFWPEVAPNSLRQIRAGRTRKSPEDHSNRPEHRLMKFSLIVCKHPQQFPATTKLRVARLPVLNLSLAGIPQSFHHNQKNAMQGLSSPYCLIPRPSMNDKDSDWYDSLSPDPTNMRNVFLEKASRILPFLYLGNEIDCSNGQLFEDHHITSVLNVTPKLPFLDENRFSCHRLSASDSMDQDLRPHFDSAFRVIEQARLSGNNILVHCHAGVSRSPSIIIAYLMAHSSLNLREAYLFVKTRRPIISPNFAFLGQLSDFEEELLSGRYTRRPNTLQLSIPPCLRSWEEKYEDDIISLMLKN